MKWSLKIGKFVGIEVYMHFTFLPACRLGLRWFTGSGVKVSAPHWLASCSFWPSSCAWCCMNSVMR